MEYNKFLENFKKRHSKNLEKNLETESLDAIGMRELENEKNERKNKWKRKEWNFQQVKKRLFNPKTKYVNLEKLLLISLYIESKTIYDIMKELKIPKTTLINNIDKLIKKGIVIKERIYTGKKGRPKTDFKRVK